MFSRINDNKFTNKTKANEVLEKYINFINDILRDKYNCFLYQKIPNQQIKNKKYF
jgi:hypothetical protein